MGVLSIANVRWPISRMVTSVDATPREGGVTEAEFPEATVRAMYDPAERGGGSRPTDAKHRPPVRLAALPDALLRRAVPNLTDSSSQNEI